VVPCCWVARCSLLVCGAHPQYTYVCPKVSLSQSLTPKTPFVLLAGFVCPSGCTYTSITTAIGAVTADGEVVSVAAGSYTEETANITFSITIMYANCVREEGHNRLEMDLT
jgi:hypothetical protein